jgi:hypothetical protein
MPNLTTVIVTSPYHRVLPTQLLLRATRRRLQYACFTSVTLERDAIEEIARCKTLRGLTFCICDLSGAPLEPLAALADLEGLWITSAIPLPASTVDVICSLPRLKEVVVSGWEFAPADTERLRATVMSRGVRFWTYD